MGGQGQLTSKETAMKRLNPTLSYFLKGFTHQPNRITPPSNKKLRINAGERKGDIILVKR